jgi:hypothetical protein
MVMGNRGTALYPRDETMRYRGDPTGERLTHAEMAQKARLERCFGGRSQPGPKNGGRIPIKGPSPVPERAAPDYGPVWSRRPPPARTVATPPAPPRGAAPPPIRRPFSHPPAPPPQARVGEGEGGEDVEGLLVHGSHKDRCFLSQRGCQACCSHQDPRIRCRCWRS